MTQVVMNVLTGHKAVRTPPTCSNRLQVSQALSKLAAFAALSKLLVHEYADRMHLIPPRHSHISEMLVISLEFIEHVAGSCLEPLLSAFIRSYVGQHCKACAKSSSSN